MIQIESIWNRTSFGLPLVDSSRNLTNTREREGDRKRERERERENARETEPHLPSSPIWPSLSGWQSQPNQNKEEGESERERERDGAPLGFHLVSDCVAFAFHLDPAPGRAPVGYHAGSIGVQFWVLLA